MWVPCALLLLFTPLELLFINRSKHNHIPWSFLNVSKIIVTVCLIVLSIADLAMAGTLAEDHPDEIFDVHFTTPAIRIVVFALAIILVLMHRRSGIRSSGLMFIFWAATMALAMPQYRTEIRHIIASDGLFQQDAMAWRDFKAMNYMIFFPLLVVMFVLNCVSDKAPVKTVKTPEMTPEIGASFLRKMLFQWFDILMWRGYKKPIEAHHIWNLMDEDLTRSVTPAFDKYWAESVAKNQRKEEHQRQQGKASSTPTPAGKTNGSILPAMIKAFGGPFLLAGFLKLCIDLLGFASPQLLG